MTTTTLPPGPPGHPLTGVLAELKRDQPGSFTTAAMEYGDIVHEALRLYPPAYAFARDSVAETEIGGYRLPANSTVADGRAKRRLPRFAYFPFGGPHLCIGASFAMLEATLVLATVAQPMTLARRSPSKAGVTP